MQPDSTIALNGLPLGVTVTAGIGDITSTAKGSAARFNAGKPDMSLIPLSLIANGFYHPRFNLSEQQMNAVAVLNFTGKFQTTGDVDFLYDAISAIDNDWEACARVFEFGKKKYAAWNWAKGFMWSVPIACIGRHCLKIIQKNEEFDDDSTLPHTGHIMCNLVMLLTFVETYKEGNDLPIQWLCANVSKSE